MLTGISASLAGLWAFGKKLSSTAGNVANVNTNHYKATTATVSEDGHGLPEVTLRKNDSPGALVQENGALIETSNMDLGQEFPQMIISQRGYEANLVALRTQHDTEKSLMDILA